METLTQAKPKGGAAKGGLIASSQAVDPDKIIIFRAFRKTQLPVKVGPLQDHTGKHFTGQGETGYFEDLSDEQKKKMSNVITPATRITIREGLALYVGKVKADAENWVWMQKHPYLAMTYEAGRSSRDAVYYVYDQLREAEALLSRTEKLDEAAWLLRQASNDKRIKLAAAFGLGDAESAPATIVHSWLRDLLVDPEKGTKNAVKMLALLQGDEGSHAIQDAMALFHMLKTYSIVQKHRGGMFRWSGENGLVIGATEDACIEFLTKPENAETVVALKAELLEKKTTN